MITSRKISKVFLMLGGACNLSCLYCVQGVKCKKELVYPDQCVYDLIKSVKNVVFYGGEPLLYLPVIKKIVDTVDADYKIITNGKLLTNEVIDWLNDNNVAVALSWDGRFSRDTRGYDVINENPGVLRIKRLGLSGVLSAMTITSFMLDDYQDFDDKYFALHGYHINVNIDELIFNDYQSKKLTDIPFLLVAKDMSKMIDEVMSIEKKPYVKNVYLSRLLLRLYKKSYCGNQGSCRNGINVINVDMHGNLYACHNLHEPIGHINGNYAEYYKKLLNSSHSLKYVDKCINCYVRDICRGGCKLVDKYKRENGYCELKLALYTPLVDFYRQIILKGDSKNGNNY